MMMRAIEVPASREELELVGNELLDAHYFANATTDPDEVKRANRRIDECERALDLCLFTLDEKGVMVPKVV